MSAQDNGIEDRQARCGVAAAGGLEAARHGGSPSSSERSPPMSVAQAEQGGGVECQCGVWVPAPPKRTGRTIG